MNPYEDHLDRNAANYAALTPLSFIARTAYIWPHRVAVDPRRAALHVGRDLRALAPPRLRTRAAAASARATPIAVMLANTPEMIECHFGVPMTGGVLNTLNTRLDARGDRVHAGARRGEGAAHRHRIRADRREGAGAR